MVTSASIQLLCEIAFLCGHHAGYYCAYFIYLFYIRLQKFLIYLKLREEKKKKTLDMLKYQEKKATD